jgi:hypothetical protein
MKKLIFFALLHLSASVVYSQEAIDVVEKSIKVGSMATESEYYGFAEGDKVIFSLTVEKGKELKDVTVAEYPNSIKFAQHTIEKIENKVLNVSRNGIYKFDYYNSNVSGRTVNIKIQRIPKGDKTKFFNTNVKWVNKVDTVYEAQIKTYVISSDTTFPEVINSTVRVNSKTNLSNPNKTIVDFILPANTIKWTYWIGVGDESQKTFEQDKARFASAGGKLLSTINPLVGIAFGLFTMSQANIGENVKYSFLSNYENAQKFMAGVSYKQFKQGNSIVDFGLMNYASINNEKYYLGLENDNFQQGINVNVKILAVVVNNKTENRTEKIPVYLNNRIPIHEE